MKSKSHWENVYSTKSPEHVGWYEPHLHTSLAMIANTAVGVNAQVIDVGGGASTLVDDLLGQGYEQITILDLSSAALSATRSRLGAAASKVKWIEDDIKTVELPPAYFDIWHDRAVFHFLTKADDRQQYMNNMQRSVKGDGHVIIATFSLEAPPICSGLEVQRYTPELLQNELGESFELQEHTSELHLTPGGVEHMYLYCHFRRQFHTD
jgi:ubiquinone/menaquinone biosynthesis C-methylase UbiE